MILTTFSIEISGQTSPLPSSMNSSSITQQPQVQSQLQQQGREVNRTEQQQHPVHHPATITNHHHTTNVLSTMRSLNEKSRNLSKAKINTSKLLTPLDPNKLKLKLTIDSKFKETVHANKDLTTSKPPRYVCALWKYSLECSATITGLWLFFKWELL